MYIYMYIYADIDWALYISGAAVFTCIYTDIHIDIGRKIRTNKQSRQTSVCIYLSCNRLCTCR